MSPAFLIAIALSVTDGDTIKVRVPHWSGTPLGTTYIRVLGINAPESHPGQAKCSKELELGKQATAYAEKLIPPNTRLRFVFKAHDKYGGRVLGTIKLPDGRDFGTVMVGAGLAQPYDGKKKGSFCK